MAEPARGDTGTQDRRVAGRVTLALTLLFVLASITVSAGLVVHTAWLHDLSNGPFAILFAVLSGKAVLSWRAWSDQDNNHARLTADQPKQD